MSTPQPKEAPDPPALGGVLRDCDLEHAKIAGFAGIISKHLKENYHGNQAEEKKPPSGVWP